LGAEDPKTEATSFCGSVAYLAPEMLAMKGHGKAMDWYLFGVLIYEMLVGVPPFFIEDKKELFKRIEEEDPEIPENLSPEARDLISKLLVKDPRK